MYLWCFKLEAVKVRHYHASTLLLAHLPTENFAVTESLKAKPALLEYDDTEDEYDEAEDKLDTSK